MPALMPVTDVASHKCIGRYLLFSNLIHRAMQTGLQDGLAASPYHAIEIFVDSYAVSVLPHQGTHGMTDVFLP